MSEGCCPLGFFEDIEVTKGIIPYKQDTRILLFTDGVSEWLEEEYEDAIPKLLSYIQEQGLDNPADILQQLQPSLELLNAQKDDMCLVMISTNDANGVNIDQRRFLECSRVPVIKAESTKRP